MEHRYCAFISYRHAPLDSRIAREIQQRLERFRIPGAIVRRTGRKRLGSVFRDKEELPITSDLNDNINRALENSDYLIVICSPRTRESIWVQKEIETFLHTHGRGRVLTVLAEGEPGDVIPELLLRDEIADPETGEVRTVPVEPLSCDYRLPLRRARSEELPRLAATILDCGYDDLRQRQKLYQTRRLTAVLAGAMALSVAMTAYFLWSNGKIRENYNRAEENYQLARDNYAQAQENYAQARENYTMALRNQSVYLAAESQNARRNGDRSTAALLAMAALPQSPDDDRPVTPEAELALSQAVDAYICRESNVYDMQMKCVFTDDVNIEGIWSGPDGRILAAVNSSDILIVWDTQTRRELWRRSLTGYYHSGGSPDGSVQIRMTGGGRMLLRDGDSLFCLDPRTGEAAWTVGADAFGGDLLLALLTPGEEQLLLFCSSDVGVQCLDAEDGSLLWSCAYPKDPSAPEKTAASIHAGPDSVFSPNGQIAAFSVELNDGAGSYRSGLLLDLDARAWIPLPGRYREIGAICPLDDKTAVILGCGDDAAEGIIKYDINNHEALVSVCRESADAVLWQTTLDYYIGSAYEAVFPGAEADVFCCISDLIVRLDLQTGALRTRLEAPSPLVGCPNPKNGRSVIAVLSDGSIANFQFDDAECGCFSWFAPDVKQALYFADKDRGVPGYYVLNNFSNTVSCYELNNFVDENYTAMSGDAVPIIAAVRVFDAQRYLRSWTESAADGSVCRLACFAMPDGAPLWQVDGPDDCDALEIIDGSPELETLIVQTDRAGDRFGAVDTRTGALTELPAPQLTQYHNCLGACLLGNTFCRLYRCADETNSNMNAAFVFLLDLQTGETDLKKLSRMPAYVFYSNDVYRLSDGFLVRMQGDPDPTLVRIDPIRGTEEALDARWLDWTPGPAVRTDGSDGLCFFRENEISLTDAHGAEQWTVATDPYIASAAYDANSECLLLLGTNGQIYVYSLSGQQIAVLDPGIDTASSTYSFENAAWLLEDPSQDVLFLKNTAYLFDPEVWKLTAVVDRCWHVSGDRYYCIRPTDDPENGSSLITVYQDVYYDRYSLDELMEKGRLLTDGQTLKDPEKYGLPSSS